MPNEIKLNTSSARQSSKCVASVVLIALQSSDISYRHYSTKLITVNGIVYAPRITSFGGVSTRQKDANSATASSVSFSLADVGGQLKGLVDTYPLEGKKCFIYQYFPNSPGSEATNIFKGVVAGPVRYNEDTGIYDFQIESNVYSNQVGYNFQSGDFGLNNEQAAGQIWPKVFGKVAHVPALKVQQQAHSELKYDFGFSPKSGIDTLLKTVDNELELAIDLRTRSYNELETVFNKFEVQDARQFDSGEITVAINEVWFKGSFSGNQFSVVEANASKGTVNILPRVVGDQDEDNPSVLWVETTNSLIDQHLDIIYDIEDPPLETTRKVILQENNKIWLEAPIKKHEVTDVEDRFVKLDETHSITGIRALSLIATEGNVRELFNGIKALQKGLIPIPDPASNDPVNDSKSVINLFEVLSFYKSAFWTRTAGTIVRQVSNSPDIYVANDTSSFDVTSVYGVREVDGEQKFLPIPSSYYSVNLDRSVNIINGPQRVTTIEFAHPLITYRNQGWKDEVYVTVDSHNINEPTAVIEHLLGYTSIEPNVTSFADTRTHTRNYPCNFVLTEQRDALKMIEDIAYQSRIGVIYDSEFLKVKYLANTPSADIQINDDDILFGSVKESSVNHTSLETSIRGVWRTHQGPNLEEAFLRIQQNVEAFGFREKEINFEIYNLESLVRISTDFWCNRLSNIWRTITFRTFHNLCGFHVFDTIQLNSAFLPVVKCVITNITNQVIDGMVEVTVELPIKQGATAVVSNYWDDSNLPFQPLNPANEYTIVDYDVQVVRNGLTLEDMMNRLKSYRRQQKLLAIVTARTGDVATVTTFANDQTNVDPETTTPLEEGATAVITSPAVNAEVGDQVVLSVDEYGDYYINNSGNPNVRRFVRIITAIEDTVNENRWLYEGVLQDLKPNGTFADSTTGEVVSFYNVMEANNTSVGVVGSGDDISHFPPGVSIRPLGISAVVLIEKFIDCFGNSVWLLPNTPNNAGGSCQ